MRKVMLAPSVMCLSEWQGADRTLRELEDSGADLLHADVMDGSFVPNLMLGTESIRNLRKASSVPLDLHLMIERPEDKLDWFDIRPGEFVSVHVESTVHLQKVLAKIRACGAHPMAALNPATPLCALENILPDIDGVLLMTVNPGFAGQALIPQMLDKIARTRAMLDSCGMERLYIEVDGNVSFENARKMRQAGADVFVGGTSSIFCKGRSIAENMAELRECTEEA